MVGSGERAVPKFGSFQPKKRPSGSNATRLQQDSKRNTGKVESSKHNINKSKAKSRSRKHEGDTKCGPQLPEKPEPRDRSSGRATDRRHHERVTSQHSKSRSERSDRKIGEKPGSFSQDSNVYVVDKKGDQANLQYRYSNKWTVPLYRLYGSGSILGLHPDIKIDRRLSDDRGYTLVYPTKSQHRTMVNADDLWEPRETVKAETESRLAEKDKNDRGDDEGFISMPKDPIGMCYDYPCISTQ